MGSKWNPFDDESYVRGGADTARDAVGSTIESVRNVGQRYNPYALAQGFRRSPFARGAYSKAAPFIPGLSLPSLFLQPEQMGIKNERNQDRFDKSQRASRIGTGAAAAIGGGAVFGPEVMAWIAANPALAAKLGLTAASLVGGMGGKGNGASGSGGGAPGPQPSTGVVPRPRPTSGGGSDYDRLNQYLGRTPGSGMPGGGGGSQMNPQRVQQLIAMLQSFLGTSRPGGGSPPATGGYPRPYPGYGPNGGAATRPSLPSDRSGYTGIPYGAYQGADGKWYVAQ
jgi:hypothetical protein